MARSSSLMIAMLIATALPLAVAFRRAISMEDMLASEAEGEEPPEVALDFANVGEDISTGMTRLRFKMDWGSAGSTGLAEVDAHAAVNSSADVEMETTVSAEQTAKNIEVEMAYYYNQKAVRKFWKHTTKTTDYSVGALAEKVAKIRSNPVPGLKGVTFGTVFAALQNANCPLWMIGGTVRDLLAGSAPNDVDCVALCNSREIRKLAKSKGWKHSDGGKNDDAKYFSIGEAHGDDPDYLEGFSIDLVFESEWSPEWSVNMLLWSLSTDLVIDPSGFGRKDAIGKILRPGAPSFGSEGVNTYHPDKTQWTLWEEWLEGAFSGMARHVRYLKMRGRGWQPSSECVRVFMGNRLWVASTADNKFGKEEAGLISVPAVDGDTEIYLEAGLLALWLSEQVLNLTPAQQADKVFLLLNAMRTDVGAPIKSTQMGGQCVDMRDPKNKKAVLAKTWEQEKTFYEVLEHGLVATCQKPAKFVIAKALKYTGNYDWNAACKNIVLFINSMK